MASKESAVSEVLELRVHGVSNTPPETLLREPGLDDVQADDLVRVAGDESTGFYRRPVQADGGYVTEAYSWGALTAGDRARKDIERAAWALLLPFALANVAIWARPEVPASAEDESRLAQLTAYVVRLLALSLTCTLVLALSGVAMDQVAWQCHQGGCAKVPPHTDFLRANGMWSQGTRPVALAMAAPLVLLALLAVASLRSFAYEAEQPETTGGDGGVPTAPASPLECRTFWRGDGQIRRLALLHVSAGVIACSTVLLVSTWQVDRRAGTSWGVRGGGVVAAVLLALAAAFCLWVLSTHQVRFRGQQTGSQLPSTGYGQNSPRVFALAMVGAAITVAYALASDRTGTRRDGTLPGYASIVLTLALSQLVLVLVLVWLCRRGTHRAAAVTSRERTAYGEGRSEVVWNGCGSAVLSASGWLLGCLYSAGLLFWCADWLNGPATVTSSYSVVAVPPVLLWSGLGLLAVAGLLLVLLVIGGWRLQRDLGAQRGRALADFGVDATDPRQQHETRRAGQVGRWRAVHALTGDRLLSGVGRAGVGVLLVAIACGLCAATTQAPQELTEGVGPDWLMLVTKWATDTGAAVSGLVVIGMALLIGATYRGAGPRKILGIVWDLATFWPRGAHPFAPPCYAERVVPHIVTRVSGLAPQPVILSGHSQGSLICVAAVAQLRGERRKNVHLLTFGTQLDRLYGRVFPAIIGPLRRDRVAGLLSPGDGTTRWTSLHRPTDPLGWEVGRVLVPDGDSHRWYDGVDVAVRDPQALPAYATAEPSPADLRPSGGEVLDPPISQHSDYVLSVEYAAARAAAMVGLGAPVVVTLPSASPSRPPARPPTLGSRLRDIPPQGAAVTSSLLLVLVGIRLF